MGASMWYCGNSNTVVYLLVGGLTAKKVLVSTIHSVCETLVKCGVSTAQAIKALNALSTKTKITSSIRFDCEIPDSLLQNKIFQFLSTDDLGFGDFYVNARGYLILSVDIVNGYGCKTFTRKKVKFSGTINPEYMDENGNRFGYTIRFIGGYMAACVKVDDNE